MKKTIYLLNAIVLLAVSLLAFSCDPDDATPIVAQFSTEKMTYYTDEEIQLTNTSIGGSGPLSYLWDFGNETSSTEVNPIVVYEEAGIYTIKLTASDGKTSVITQKNIQIENAPEPDKGEIELKWVGKQYLNDIRSVSPAVDNDGNVIMTSDDHILRKFSKTDGSVMWSFDMWNATDGVSPEGSTHGSPSIDTDGTIFIGTGSTSGKIARFYAVSSTGSKKWVIAGDANTGFWNKGAASTPRIMQLAAAINQNSVFAGNTGSTGSVLALDKTTGARKGYVTDVAGTGGPAGGVTTGVLLTKSNKLVWYGGIYGLYTASATALELGAASFDWSLYLNPVEQRTEQQVGASMAIGSDGTIYGIGSFNSNVFGGPSAFAVNQDGTQKWKTSLDCGQLDQGGVVIDKNETVYVSVKTVLGESNGGVIALDAETGTIKWRFAIAEDVSGTPAIDQAGNIHFATDKGNYYIIKSDGSPDPVIVKSDLTTLIIESGSPYATGWVQSMAKCWSSPVIDDDGSIYIGITNTETRSRSLLLALTHKNVTGLQSDAPWPMRAQNRRHTNVQP